MRLTALLRYHFMTIKNSLLIFYTCFVGGSLFGIIVSAVAAVSVVGVNQVNGDGTVQSWSATIIAPMIFMLVSSLVGSQSDARFLITRSVSRKEVFFSNAIFLMPLGAIMAALQVVWLYIEAALRYIFTGGAYRGLAVDIQSYQAPNMGNPLVFFAVSFSLMLCAGTVGFLLGSCMARWKAPTICALVVLGIVFFACLTISGFMQWLLDAFRYLFTDPDTGLLIALKQAGLAAVIMAVAFPVMRRITAARQS